MLPRDIVRPLQNELSRYPAVLRAILFGSRAMGTHRPNSDIDLCLEAPDLKFQDFLRLASALDNLVLPYSLDLVLQHHIDNPELVNHIQRVGVVVYARS
jgi:predicted nucleotidyltransferase